ncbi:MAG: TIGR00730 family Rossman fold protein [Planctomycetota bacterium]
MTGRPFAVTVYGSSSELVDRAYFAVAQELGRRIAERGHELVFGGGRYGLMGAVSRGALAAGGRVKGVILRRFVEEGLHSEGVAEMIAVDDMRARKRGLAEAGDAYVALPGGFGTLEEVLEMLSFKQLGLHRKPIVLLDACGYWQPLIRMIEKSFEQRFIQPRYRGMYDVARSAGEAMDLVESKDRWRPGPPDPRAGGRA